ncbi:hypothetical protein A1A1_07739 [Planococcus antarcticus DSM 14505]|uniref:Uncharacterized protein n=1 Tax=Planococcus antarcticus DSM 14505 TaxID=1185653 RepID=A0A1C7DHG9_9BACL|nr:hypothetical protein [Planococcus antarcticus]ANU11019.1 hypothetical protein BBH88_12245 [Planococcus antarcticus DSM 14505]EIM07050.1 hypothetical protein A1A1_07739 [Planococcus antarcticus DSM 14505]
MEMKYVWQSLLGAVVIHILYFSAGMAVGYVKTITYKPNFSNVWENAENLPSTVEFVYATSPVLYVVTFLATAIVCNLLLVGYKKLATHPLHMEKL